MKNSLDLKDRTYQMLLSNSFDDNVDGIYVETDITDPGKEFITITSPGISHGDDVVDKGDVSINLNIVDIKGSTDAERFRYLIKILEDILEQYDPYDDSFIQYSKDNDGNIVESTVTPTTEYFHIRPVWSDGTHHDPERQGYSYYSIRTSCWIEK